MKLCDLAGEFETGPDGAHIDITGLTSDSRRVEPGFLFAALAGTKANGESFLADAERRGAAALLVSKDATIDSRLPLVRVDDPRRALS